MIFLLVELKKTPIFQFLMSQHKSLRGSGKIVAKRNVLKRFERIDLLKKRGKWKEDSKIYGLPKTLPEG